MAASIKPLTGSPPTPEAYMYNGLDFHRVAYDTRRGNAFGLHQVPNGYGFADRSELHRLPGELPHALPEAHVKLPSVMGGMVILGNSGVLVLLKRDYHRGLIYLKPETLQPGAGLPFQDMDLAQEGDGDWVLQDLGDHRFVLAHCNVRAAPRTHVNHARIYDADTFVCLRRVTFDPVTFANIYVRQFLGTNAHGTELLIAEFPRVVGTGVRIFIARVDEATNVASVVGRFVLAPSCYFPMVRIGRGLLATGSPRTQGDNQHGVCAMNIVSYGDENSGIETGPLHIAEWRQPTEGQVQRITRVGPGVVDIGYTDTTVREMVMTRVEVFGHSVGWQEAHRLGIVPRECFVPLRAVTWLRWRGCTGPSEAPIDVTLNASDLLVWALLPAEIFESVVEAMWEAFKADPVVMRAPEPADKEGWSWSCTIS